FSLRDGDLALRTINSTDPLILRLNGLKLTFNNATSVKGDVFTYQKNDKDLNATIELNNKDKTWNIGLLGKRISNNYVGPELTLGLQIGNKSASSLININQTTRLKTPNIASSTIEGFLSELNALV
ncbi:MAG: hypothetical protein LUQ50_04310, partial [Methanospirillum sp.]|uniref:hypothetical protein n=1 Tax=Methanospirillum sp. TaxID=45200 RepID=UPI002374E1FB